MTSNQGQQWNKVQVNVTSRPEYILAFQGTVGNGFTGDLAIDDLSLTPGPCAAPATNPSFPCGNGKFVPMTQVCDFTPQCANKADEKSCGNCTFDGVTGTCGWSDKSAGSFRWTRHNNGTETANTGPSADHTTNTPRGYYMYVDASNGQRFTQAALASPTLHQASVTCQMSFYYHMYGQSIGVLMVYRVDQTSTTRLLFLRGNKGNKWNQATVNIGRVASEFHIEFRASRSFSVVGDVAIDDVTFTNCALPPIQPSCGVNQFRCARGSCIDRSRLCDFTDDCGDSSDESRANCQNVPSRCTFTSSICDWTQAKGDKFDWIQRNGATPSRFTGPTKDHTSGG